MLRRCVILETVVLCLMATSSMGEVSGPLKNKQLVRIPKQIKAHPTVVNTEQDHQSDETGGQHLFEGSAAGLGHGKYFQDAYIYLFGPLQLEFGHVAETPAEWEQRFEKKDDKCKRYQGKARWGDKHGGYGEHYWDYNHAGHDHGGGGGGGGGNDEESHDEDEGDYSHHVPDYLSPSETDSSGSSRNPNQAMMNSAPGSDERVKRQPGKPTAIPQKLSVAAHLSPVEGPISLIYDIESGTVVNEATGQSYILHPVN